MAKTNSLRRLAELAEKATQKALEQVGQTKALHQNGLEQIQKLEQYRHDYLQQLQASMVSGVRSSVAINTSGFIDNIDRAIAQQQERIQEIENALEASRNNWMDKRRRSESLLTLVARGDAAQMMIANRLEQKSNDEFAARSYARMRLA